MSKLKLKLKNSEAIEGEIIPLNIEVSKSDPSATLIFKIGRLPADARLTAGTCGNKGVWTLSEEEIVGLRLIPGLGFKGPIDVHVEAEENIGGQSSVDVGSLRIYIAELADEEYRQKRKNSLIPATNAQRVRTVVLLIISLFLFFLIWFYLLKQVQDVTTQEFQVTWEQPAGTILDSGDSSFWYDKDGKTIRHIGIIDGSRKMELIELLRVESNEVAGEAASNPSNEAENQNNKQESTNDNQKLESYKNAVGELAFKSVQASKYYLIWLFMIAGVSGMIGVQARAIGNFIKIACFSNVLDIHRFWPWYVMRPTLGFILGATIVLLVQSSIFVPGETAEPKGTLWWLAISFVVGFGADDFTGRLRLLSQTLFGKSDKK